MDAYERFWSKVEKTDHCWLWKAARRGNGYGCFAYKGHLVSAHRMAYELAHGKIAPGLLVLHKCDNRQCVNPAHLFLGTWQDNTRDALHKGRHSLPKTHSHPKFGEQSSRHKLTEDDVRQIWQLHNEGLGYKRLGTKFNVDPKTIAFIIKGKTWPHLYAVYCTNWCTNADDIQRQKAA